jgi:hypothetical protein
MPAACAPRAGQTQLYCKFVCVCVRACVRAGVRTCVRACVLACEMHKLVHVHASMSDVRRQTRACTHSPSHSPTHPPTQTYCALVLNKSRPTEPLTFYHSAHNPPPRSHRLPPQPPHCRLSQVRTKNAGYTEMMASLLRSRLSS